jgi:hypothetical protein
MTSLTIEPKWAELLRANGLGDFESLAGYSAGTCLSRHSRGQTYRCVLNNGQTVFIKQDNFTKWVIVLRSLLRGRRPETNTEKERRCYLLAERRGFRVVQVIAYGQERRFGLPRRGVIVTLPVEGTPLDKFCAKCADAEKRRQAIQNAEAVLKRLQDEGLDWTKDCKPEHFFVSERDLSISLIDLERLKDRGHPLDAERRKMQLERFHSLLPRGN